ncbi:hypothetical protein NPIL_220911, partial [Nephila pilipes]
PLDLSIHATRDASSRSDRPLIISLPFSEESPSDHQQVGTSELPGPVIIRDVSSNSCDLEITLGHQLPKQSLNKEFPCSFCSKLFIVKRSLKTHIRIHVEKKTIRMRDMWRKLYYKRLSEKSHENAFGENTFYMRYMWEEVYKKNQPENSY